MGKWALVFGKEEFDDIGIVLAGTNQKEFEKKVLNMFDEVISSKDSVYHTHLVRKGDRLVPLVTNVYGAPAMLDVLTQMCDGGCKTVIFVGYAYGGFKNLNVGDVVIPNKAYHFDGVYHALKIDKEATLPDKELRDKLKKVLNTNKIKFTEGTNISVPAVSFQLPHNNETYKKIDPDTVEMELAACLSRTKDIGMRSAGILIISDNRSSSIGDEKKRELRWKQKEKLIKTIIENIEMFGLTPLKVKEEFSVDEHLASIIHDPEDETNVYRN